MEKPFTKQEIFYPLTSCKGDNALKQDGPEPPLPKQDGRALKVSYFFLFIIPKILQEG